MRKRTLALCVTLLAILAMGSPIPVGAGEIKDAACPALTPATGAEAQLAVELFGRQPIKQAGCYISCNTDFNVSCHGTGLFTCGDGVDSGGYYIQCNGVRYYCPPCPSGNPYDCLD